MFAMNMKKKSYITAYIIAELLVPESSLLTSSLIEVGGGTDEFDTQMKGGNDFLEQWEEYAEQAY